MERARAEMWMFVRMEQTLGKGFKGLLRPPSRGANLKLRQTHFFNLVNPTHHFMAYPLLRQQQWTHCTRQVLFPHLQVDPPPENREKKKIKDGWENECKIDPHCEICADSRLDSDLSVSKKEFLKEITTISVSASLSYLKANRWRSSLYVDLRRACVLMQYRRWSTARHVLQCLCKM